MKLTHNSEKLRESLAKLGATLTTSDAVDCFLIGNPDFTNQIAGVLAPAVARIEYDLLAGLTPSVAPLLHTLATFLGDQHYVGYQSPCCPTLIPHVNNKKVILISDILRSHEQAEQRATKIQATGGKVLMHITIFLAHALTHHDHYRYLETLPPGI